MTREEGIEDYGVRRQRALEALEDQRRREEEEGRMSKDAAEGEGVRERKEREESERGCYRVRGGERRGGRGRDNGH